MRLTSNKLLCIGASVLLLGGCDKLGPAPAAAPQKQDIVLPKSAIYEAEKRSLRPEFKLPAITEAEQDASIRPEVQAPIKANHFRAGDLVKKGDLLVELEPAKFHAKLEAAKAQLSSARANEKQAATNWTRAKQLKPKGHISAMDYDKAQAAIATSRAAVAEAQAGLERAELDMEHTKLYAPFDGKISKPNHGVGNLVGPLSPKPLFQLVQLDPIYVTTDVPLDVYNDFVALRMKAKAENVDIPDISVTLVLAGGAEYDKKGDFEAWSHSSQGSGTIAGRVLFANPEGILLPGQNVTLKGQAAKAVERVIVPQKAVMQDQQGRFIKVVGEDNTVQRRNVVVGIRSGVDWAVREGVEVGDKVIVAGAQALKPGTPVTIGE